MFWKDGDRIFCAELQSNFLSVVFSNWVSVLSTIDVIRYYDIVFAAVVDFLIEPNSLFDTFDWHAASSLAISQQRPSNMEWLSISSFIISFDSFNRGRFRVNHRTAAWVWHIRLTSRIVCIYCGCDRCAPLKVERCCNKLRILDATLSFLNITRCFMWGASSILNPHSVASDWTAAVFFWLGPRYLNFISSGNALI